MRIAIVSTGNELLKGLIADTNASWMASKLDEAGFSVDRIITVGDDLKAISKVLGDMFEEFDLVIVGGGLGPTDDDLTAEAAAMAVSLPLSQNAEAEEQVRAAFKRIDRDMAEVNLKQAFLPSGCTVLKNNWGTAPGFEITTIKGRAVFLPGVPSEMKPMFEKYVIPSLPEEKSPRNRIIFKCFSRGESDVQTAMKPVARDYPSIRWSYRASFPELCLTLEGPDARIVALAEQKVEEALGRAVFAREDIDLATALGKALKAKSLTVATAESCTGGQIGHLITEIAGSSEYFRGGVIAYSNEIKETLLDVPRDVLDSKGAVSEEVVVAMAEGVRKSLRADVGIAVSGIAGPEGGTPDKPVGLVHFAVSHPNGIEHRQKTFHGYNRSRVKKISAWTAMWTAFRAISED